MYKVRIQIYIKDDHGEDILTTLERPCETIRGSLVYIDQQSKIGVIQAVRMVKVNG